MTTKQEVEDLLIRRFSEWFYRGEPYGGCTSSLVSDVVELGGKETKMLSDERIKALAKRVAEEWYVNDSVTFESRMKGLAKAIEGAIRVAVAAEREACARIAGAARGWNQLTNVHAAIRARG